MDKRSSSSDQSEYEARDIRPEVSNDESADHSNVQHVLPVAPRDSHSSASVLNKDTSIHTLNLTTSAHAASFLGSWITPFRDDYVFDHLGESPPGFQSKADEPEKSTHTDLALDGSDVPQARSHTSDVSLLGITPELEFGNEATAEGSEETKQTGISNALKILELPRHPRRRGRPRNKKVYHAPQKTGCDTCRLMKKKCDETKPICKVCERNNVYCGGYEQKQTWPRNNQGKRSLVVHNDAEPSLTDERGSVAIRDDLASASAICELCIKDISNYLEQLPQGEGSSFVIQQPTATPNDVISAYENELKDGRARLKLLLQDLDSISKSLFFGKRPNAQRIMQGLLADLNDLMITFWRVHNIIEGDRNLQALDKEQVAVEGEERGGGVGSGEYEMPPCEVDVLFERASETIDDLFRETKLLRRCQETAMGGGEGSTVPEEGYSPVGTTEGRDHP